MERVDPSRGAIACPRQGERFQCPSIHNNYVKTQTSEVDGVLRFGLYAQPVAGATVAVEYPAAVLGRELVVGAGLHHVWQRRDGDGVVELKVSIDGTVVATLRAGSKTGWTLQHVDTAALAGRTARVRFEISANNTQARHLAFAAEARSGMRTAEPAWTRCGSSMSLNSAMARHDVALPSSRQATDWSVSPSVRRRARRVSVACEVGLVPASAALWPEIRNVRILEVRGPRADAALLHGWLCSRLKANIRLRHVDARSLSRVAVDGQAVRAPRRLAQSFSDQLSDQLEVYTRDRIYEAAVRAV